MWHLGPWWPWRDCSYYPIPRDNKQLPWELAFPRQTSNSRAHTPNSIPRAKYLCWVIIQSLLKLFKLASPKPAHPPCLFLHMETLEALAHILLSLTLHPDCPGASLMARNVLSCLLLERTSENNKLLPSWWSTLRSFPSILEISHLCVFFSIFPIFCFWTLVKCQNISK
jgi:hypothetical protein